MSVQAEELIKKIKLEAKKADQGQKPSYDNPSPILYNHLTDVRIILSAPQLEKILNDVRQSVIWPEIVSFLLLAIVLVTVDFKDWFLSAGQWRLIVTAALLVSSYRMARVLVLLFRGRLSTPKKIMKELLDNRKQQE